MVESLVQAGEVVVGVGVGGVKLEDGEIGLASLVEAPLVLEHDAEVEPRRGLIIGELKRHAMCVQVLDDAPDLEAALAKLGERLQ